MFAPPTGAACASACPHFTLGPRAGPGGLEGGRCLRIYERQYFTCEMITGRITSLAMHARAALRDPAARWSLHRFVLAAQARAHVAPASNNAQQCVGAGATVRSRLHDSASAHTADTRHRRGSAILTSTCPRPKQPPPTRCLALPSPRVKAVCFAQRFLRLARKRATSAVTPRGVRSLGKARRSLPLPVLVATKQSRSESVSNWAGLLGSAILFYRFQAEGSCLLLRHGVAHRVVRTQPLCPARQGPRSHLRVARF